MATALLPQNRPGAFPRNAAMHNAWRPRQPPGEIKFFSL
jgi:hypothetical protein